MDRFGHVGPGQREDVVVTLLIVRQAERAGIIGLVEPAVLDFGAERAIGDQNALAGFVQEAFAG